MSSSLPVISDVAPSRRTLSVLILAAALVALAPDAVRPVRAQEPLKIDITIRNHRFEPAEIKVPAGKPLVLVVKNTDATAEEFESKVLKIEKVIPGKSEGTFRVRPLTPGRYTFFGEFHEATAQGVIIAE